MAIQIKRNAIQICFLFSVLCSLFSFSHAQDFSEKKQDLVISPPQGALKVGEKLEYSLEWVGIPVGKMTAVVAGMTSIKGNECYHISAYATVNKFFAKFYNVEYAVHTYIDRHNFCTHRFEKARRVKKQACYMVIDFDYDKKEAYCKIEGQAPPLVLSSVREAIDAAKEATVKILDGTQDLFSALYYLRLIRIKEGASYPINIYYDQKNWLVQAKIGRPFLKDVVHKGSFNTFEVALESDLNEFIFGRRGLLVYFTADSRRVPLEFRFGDGWRSIRGIIKEANFNGKI